MTARWLSKNALILCASLAVLCVHLVLEAVIPDELLDPFYYFVTGFALFALAACIWRAWHCPRGLRVHWLLIATALLSWISANVIIMVSTVLNHPPSPTTTTIDDFFYFFYGIPLLLAISMPEKDKASRAFFLLELIQAVAAGYLAYVVLFGTLPFTSIPNRPLSEVNLIIVFDVQALLLAILATTRFIVASRGSVERRYLAILTGYLWLYGLSSAAYNHLVVMGSFTANHPTLSNVLGAIVDVPFLALALAALMLPTPVRHTQGSEEKTPLALLVDNARPIFFGFSIVILSAIVAQHHLAVALGFIIGAFAVYGIRSALLQSRLQQTRIALEKANGRLGELAMLDGLTGVANRRSFNDRVQTEWVRAQRIGKPLALLVMDIDHFKEFNDSYGHVVGDECLRHLVRSVRAVLHRPADMLARYGGDEFVVLLPETDASGALHVAELMKDALRTQEWSGEGSPIAITISIGCSCWESLPGATPEALFEAADKALYQAKQHGRDRVEFLEVKIATVQ
ncbi:GGDEF domain-containing protein [Terracidiphilus gabretensis]|uniref:GGDEF domain-containing protein n=1 Tax=Terracidiphilus gabretensis TaxID=1577687 RepID=UPI00071B6C07|nr:GGDEF domain-containing protein [Terracidiphilus gabretensis]